MDIRVIDNVFGADDSYRHETLIHDIYCALCVSDNIDSNSSEYILFQDEDGEGEEENEYVYFANGALDVKKDAQLALLIGDDFAQQLEFINEHNGAVDGSMLSSAGKTLATIITAVPDEHYCEFLTITLPPEVAHMESPLKITIVFSYAK